MRYPIIPVYKIKARVKLIPQAISAFVNPIETTVAYKIKASTDKHRNAPVHFLRFIILLTF